MPSLSPRIWQSFEIIFVERPKSLSATSSLSVEQNLEHWDRSIHFSQKVVGVTLEAKHQMHIQIIIPGFHATI